MHISSMLALGGLDPERLIEAGGLLLVAAVIFAESGLFFGFFLPGDSLLFTAGVFAAAGKFGLDIWTLIPVLFVAAVAGDSVGYWFGAKVGPRLFRREDSRLFHKDHLARAERFYEKYGAKTILLARFVPIVRTFAPIVAGVGRMRYRTFIAYNFSGGLLWAAGVTLIGYFFAQAIGEDIEKYLLPIVAVIIVLSVIPPAVEVYRERRKRRLGGSAGGAAPGGPVESAEADLAVPAEG